MSMRDNTWISPAGRRYWRTEDGLWWRNTGVISTTSGTEHPSTFDSGDAGESVLQEAEKLIHGARQDTHGNPLDNWERAGKLWAAILGLETVTAEQAVLCMIAVKISRQCHSPLRDNAVDIAGYAGLLELIAQAREYPA